MAFESYANGWPDLKQLQELADKCENLPTFTSSDKEAIADLISNAQALISVAEDGAEGVPFDNTGTDFTSTDVQAAIEEAASMGGGEVNYSTTERKVGTWLGEDLYETTVNVGVIAASSFVNVAHNIPNISKVVRFWGCAISSTGTCISHRDEIDANILNLMAVGTTNMTWAVGTSYGQGGVAESNLYAYIQYTKTPPETKKKER